MCTKTMVDSVLQMIQWTMDDLVGFYYQMKFDVASNSSKILKLHMHYSFARGWLHD